MNKLTLRTTELVPVVELNCLKPEMGFPGHIMVTHACQKLQ